jgi:hypothetical protein
MPRTVVFWPDETRTAVYKAMAEVGLDYFNDKVNGPWRPGGELRHTTRLSEIFQEAQLKVKLKPYLVRADISGSEELRKMALVIKKEGVRLFLQNPEFRAELMKHHQRGMKGLKPRVKPHIKVKLPTETAAETAEPYKPGYHLHPIPKGELGELSKLQEELDEAKDAAQQGVRLMVLQELSDLVGAVEAYLAKHAPDTSLLDLAAMAAVTRRAFNSGRRT